MNKVLILISLFALVGCQKKISCGVMDAPIALLAQQVAKIGECNPLILENELKQALVKIKVCEEQVMVAGLNSSPILCNLAPILVNVIGDQLGAKAECKKVGSISADLIKKALNCDEEVK